jgi:hypothetical protein
LIMGIGKRQINPLSILKSVFPLSFLCPIAIRQ